MTSRRPRAWIAALAFAAGCGSTIEHVAGQATRGAIEELEPGATDGDGDGDGDEGAVEGVTREVVDTALAEVAGTSGARGDGARGPVEVIAGRFTDGAIDAVARRIEGTGEAVAPALAATTEAVSAALIRGVREELGASFAGCTGPDRQACIERRISDLSAAVSRGAAEGMMAGLRLPVLGLTFLLGVLATLLLVWLWPWRNAAHAAPAGDRRRPMPAGDSSIVPR